MVKSDKLIIYGVRHWCVQYKLLRASLSDNSHLCFTSAGEASGKRWNIWYGVGFEVVGYGYGFDLVMVVRLNPRQDVLQNKA